MREHLSQQKFRASFPLRNTICELHPIKTGYSLVLRHKISLGV
jgi:hypothetical protein